MAHSSASLLSFLVKMKFHLLPEGKRAELAFDLDVTGSSTLVILY